MPKRIKRADIALGGVGAALVLLVIFLGAVAYSQQENQQRNEREQAAQHQTNDREQQWEALCTPITRNRPLSCVVKPPDSQADAQRAESDLRAQEQMANWALLMFFATMVGVVTTIIGLIYVVRAYFVNAKATDHAAEAARAATEANRQTRAQFIAQQRPWVSCAIDRTEAQTFKHGIVVSVEFVLTNHGQTPATAVDVRVNKIGKYDDEHKMVFEHMTVVERQRKRERGDVVFPSESVPLKITREFPIPDDCGGAPQITGWVRYWFEGANRYHLTPFRLVVGVRIKQFDSGPRVDALSVVQDTAGIAPD